MRRTSLVLAGIVGVGLSLTWAQAESRSARESKGGGVNFHLASATLISGYNKVSPGGDSGELYVGTRPVWSGKDVVSARTTNSRDGSAMELTISGEASERLAAQRRHRSGDRVAIYMDGKMLSHGNLSTASTGSRVTITGLTSVDSESVVRLLNGEQPVPAPGPSPISALITLETTGPLEGIYLVDVYVQGVTNLRTYQIGLLTGGGLSGELVREEVEVDKARPDYVFGTREVISAADQVGGRVTGVLFSGGVDKAVPAYLATYAFRPSPDATGTFEVSLETESNTFLQDEQNDRLEFRAGPAALITMGDEPTRRIIQK